MEDPVQIIKQTFSQEFLSNAGMMGFFLTILNSPEPDEVLDKVLTHWEKQKKEYISEVIKKSLEIQKKPLDATVEEWYVYGNLEPEDLQPQVNKAIYEMKKEIKKEFKKFKTIL